MTEITSAIRVNAYVIVARAVEEGVACGWQRAHKHTDTPDADTVRGAIEDAVLSELCEVLHFSDNHNG